jgi:hypothetical protein
MKKLFLTVTTLILLVSVVVSQEKPWAGWTKAEAEKILNHSAWGQTQTDTDVSEMMYSPTASPAGGGNPANGRSEATRGTTDRQQINSSRISQGATNQAVAVNYHVRLLSAKPVRQAFMRVIELTQAKRDEELLQGLRAFVERDFKDFIVVAVTVDATDPRYSAPVMQQLSSAAAGTLKNKTYLERKDGKRVFLMNYSPPIADGLGAKFIFPRIVDEKTFLTADSGYFRFYSEVNNQIKLNVIFKMSDLMYDGHLEY